MVCKYRCLHRYFAPTIGWRLSTSSRRAWKTAYRLLAYVVEQAGALGIDPDRIAVAGDSAGGNLAAVCHFSRGMALRGKSRRNFCSTPTPMPDRRPTATSGFRKDTV